MAGTAKQGKTAVPKAKPPKTKPEKKRTTKTKSSNAEAGKRKAKDDAESNAKDRAEEAEEGEVAGAVDLNHCLQTSGCTTAKGNWSTHVCSGILILLYSTLAYMRRCAGCWVLGARQRVELHGATCTHNTFRTHLMTYLR